MSWNTGSVVEEVHKRVSNIPTSISGTNMNSLVCQAAQNIENYTGVNPGTVDIVQKYHEILFCFTASKVVQVKIDASEDDKGGKGYTIGDFKINGTNYNTGNGSVLDNEFNKYINCAKEALKMLGYNVRFGKANG